MSVETMDYAAMMRRMLAAWERRLEDSDLVDVADFVAFADELDRTLHELVAAMRANGYSWTEVGRACGITRQGAQQRFGQVRVR